MALRVSIPKMIFNSFMSKKCKLSVQTISEVNSNFKDILLIVYRETVQRDTSAQPILV